MIFLDTADLAQIKAYKPIIRGVTTNPILLHKHGDSWKKRCQAIVDFVSPLPTSIQVTTEDAFKLEKQCLEITKWGFHTVIKIPIHSSSGSSNLHTIKHLSYMTINVTACMSAQQGLLAAYAGAAYVSLFCGRIANMGHDPMAELNLLRNLIDRESLPTKIIAGSVREVANVTEWLLAGAHIVTVPPEILEKMIVHPGTKEVVAQFMTDAEKLHG